MIKLSRTKLVSLLGILVLMVVGGIFVYFANNRAVSSPEKYPKKIFGKSYEQGATIYSCSREIELYDTGVINPKFEGGGPEYLPVNPTEAEKYCRNSGWVIEYRAVLDILSKEDVSKTIEKYDTTQAWVRALSHMYINDKDYLKRILPAYSDVKIDCIIVVHSPEGTRFFIENGEQHESHDDHHYIEVSDTEFLASLNSAPDADVTAFWLGLH